VVVNGEIKSPAPETGAHAAGKVILRGQLPTSEANVSNNYKSNIYHILY